MQREGFQHLSTTSHKSQRIRLKYAQTDSSTQSERMQKKFLHHFPKLFVEGADGKVYRRAAPLPASAAGPSEVINESLVSQSSCLSPLNPRIDRNQPEPTVEVPAFGWGGVDIRPQAMPASMVTDESLVNQPSCQLPLNPRSLTEV